jgi:hypothetical protein
MKKILLLISLLVSISLRCVTTTSPSAGTSDDVNTGSIYGKITCKKDTISGEITVELYKGDTIDSIPGGLRKTAQRAIKPLKSLITKNLEFSFDSLDSGAYSIRSLKEGMVIGDTEPIYLTPHEHKAMTMIVLTVIHQTFYLSIDNSQNIAVNYFYINNSPIPPDSANRYRAAFLGKDSLIVTIDYSRNKADGRMLGRLIRNANRTYRIVPFDNVTPIIIIPLPDTSAKIAAGCLVGYAVRQNGTAALNAKTTLRYQSTIMQIANGQVSSVTGLKRYDSTLINSAGSYSFDLIDTGKYIIEINDHDSMGALVQAEITRTRLICLIPTVALAKLGAIKGRIPDSLICGDSTFIYIPELNRLLPINKKGFFIGNLVPKGVYSLRLVCGRKLISSPWDTLHLNVLPGDTAVPTGFNLNNAPIFTSTASQMAKSLEANSIYCDTLHAFDPDRDTLRFSFIEHAPGMMLGDSIVYWTPSVKDSGVFFISVFIMDGNGGLDTLSWPIFVTNGKSSGNRPPVFISSASGMLNSIAVNGPYKDTILVTDPDNDQVTLNFQDSVIGMYLAHNILTWTPSGADTGNHTITILASDNKGGIDTLQWNIRVMPVDPLLYPLIGYDSLVSGSINPQKGPDRYQFLGVVGDKISLRMICSNTMDGTTTIFDPSNWIIQTTTNSRDSGKSILMDTFTILESGLYTIQIESFDRGDYSFILYSYQQQLAASRMLQYEQVYTDTIKQQLMRKVYQFQGTYGDKISFRMLCSNALAATVGIYAPGNVPVWMLSSDGAGGAPLLDTFNLWLSGTTYTLQISSNNGMSSGAFSFALYSRKQQLETSPMIQFDQAATDTLKNQLMMKTYRFQGTAGDTLSLQTLCSSTLKATIMISDPSNGFFAEMISNTYGQTISLDSFPLSKTGTYTIQIKSTCGTSSGAYSMKLTKK